MEGFTLIPKISLHNHGHVVLESTLGNDLAIVNNARVSFDQESPELGDAEIGLINFLMKNKHGSPFEAVVFRFDIKAPLFIVREWMRHRVGSFNEQSARYSETSEHYYIPEQSYMRTQVGKPGAYRFEQYEDDGQARQLIADSQATAFTTYRTLLQAGVAKEVARNVLPVGMYSRFKWTVNLRSLFNFIALRNHEHALREIRDYARVIEELATDIVPVAMSSFQANSRICP